MSLRRMKHSVSTVLIACLTLLLAACGARTQSPVAAEVPFVVDPEMLGEAYFNANLDLALKPPQGWEILEGDQRAAVLRNLSESEEVADFSLLVIDVFFDTDTLSFLSVSTVTMAGSSADFAQYASSFAELIGLDPELPSGDSQIVAEMRFAVNDVDVVQYRHLRQNRVTFTLLMTARNGEIVRLDYSIPTEVYQAESVKLESSIGTIQFMPED